WPTSVSVRSAGSPGAQLHIPCRCSKSFLPPCASSRDRQDVSLFESGRYRAYPTARSQRGLALFQKPRPHRARCPTPRSRGRRRWPLDPCAGAFRAIRPLRLRVPRSQQRETTSESIRRLEIFGLRACFVRLFHRRTGHARGMRSKSPKKPRSREQYLFPGSEIAPRPKGGMAESKKEEPNPLPVRIYKEQRNRSRADPKG